jgi:hypothetical protein
MRTISQVFDVHSDPKAKPPKSVIVSTTISAKLAEWLAKQSKLERKSPAYIARRAIYLESLRVEKDMEEFGTSFLEYDINEYKNIDEPMDIDIIDDRV